MKLVLSTIDDLYLPITSELENASTKRVSQELLLSIDHAACLFSSIFAIFHKCAIHRTTVENTFMDSK